MKNKKTNEPAMSEVGQEEGRQAPSLDPVVKPRDDFDLARDDADLNNVIPRLDRGIQKPPRNKVMDLFFIELWERFSFYGLMALLILYLIKVAHLSSHQSFLITGTYGVLDYVTPLLGGYVADKFLGNYRALVLGAFMIALGHFLTAIPVYNTHFLFYGLAWIIIGTGLLKPSIATLIGDVSQHYNYNQKSAYTQAYIGANIGTVIAPIVCSIIAVYWSWHVAFALAGVGMLFGLITAIRLKPFLPAQSFASASSQKRNTKLYAQWSAIALLLSGAIYALFSHPYFSNYIALFIVISMIFIAAKIYTSIDSKEKKALLRLIGLAVFFAVFMILLQQSGGMLNIFTEELVNRQVFGWVIPTGAYQSVEPLAFIVLGLFLSRYVKRWNLSLEKSFAIGLAIMTFSFVVLLIGDALTNYMHLQSMFWINASYLFEALGELFIGPMGTLAVKQLAPKRYVNLLMGVWMLIYSLANFSAARFAASLSLPQQLTQGNRVLFYQQYNHAFVLLAIGGAIAVGVLVFGLLLRRFPGIVYGSRGQATG
jgi:proton-dependent oligopeptide transporter, POT family